MSVALIVIQAVLIFVLIDALFRAVPRHVFAFCLMCYSIFWLVLDVILRDSILSRAWDLLNVAFWYWQWRNNRPKDWKKRARRAIGEKTAIIFARMKKGMEGA